jgi:short subunit dehydrogenase-like uncharacterized protein
VPFTLNETSDIEGASTTTAGAPDVAACASATGGVAETATEAAVPINRSRRDNPMSKSRRDNSSLELGIWAPVLWLQQRLIKALWSAMFLGRTFKKNWVDAFPRTN